MKSLKRLFVTGVLSLFFITHLFPAFKSISGIPSENFYIPIWFCTLFFMKPRVYLTREFFAASMFLIVHLLYTAAGNYDLLDLRVIQTQGEIFFGVFFALSLWAYLRLGMDTKLLKTLFWIVIIGSIATSITTIIAITQNPSAARSLAGNDNQEEVISLLRMNVGGYSFQYFLAMISPLFLYFYRKSKEKLWLIAAIIAGLSIIYAQIVAILLVYAINVIMTFALLRGITLRHYLFILFFGIFILIQGKQLIKDVLYLSAAKLTSFEVISTKLNEVAAYLETSGNLDYSNAENIYAYKIRYDRSKEAFFEAPLFGGTGRSGGHHFWIDNLAEHGVIGTAPWLLVISVFIYSARKAFKKEEFLIIFNGVIIFIIIGINKNILINSMPIYPIFLIPLVILGYKYTSWNATNKKSLNGNPA